jgi:hypothetical protein
MKKKIDRADLVRREFLKNAFTGAVVLYSNPLKLLFATLAEEMIRTSTAQALGISTDKKLLNFVFFGGLPRWNMDLPLIPDAASASKYVQNKTVGNSIDPSGSLVYQTCTNSVFNGIQMPILWSKSIPVPGGGKVPLANLAPNLLMAMGADFQIDSHPTCQRLQLQPIAGKPSFTGMIADRALTPVPSISYTGVESMSSCYVSSKGIPNLDLRGDNSAILTQALSAFSGLASVSEASNATVKTALGSLFDAMGSDAGYVNPFLPTSYSQRKLTQTLMTDGFSGLSSVLSGTSSLKAKYSDLIYRSLCGTDADIFLPFELSPLIGDGISPKWQFEVNSSGNPLYVNLDFNSCFINGTTSVSYLAASMAMAEYMFVNGYTSAANMVIGGVAAILDATGTGSQRWLGLDYHRYGAIPQMVMSIKIIRAFYACLYELTQRMKTVRPSSSTSSLFDQTLIQVTSDFNRSARTDLTGSDHGYNGSNISWVSGMISSCDLVGNIQADTNATYLGSWGKAAGVSSLTGNQTIRMGNLASTVASALEVPSPTPNDAPVYVLDSTTGKLVRASNFSRGTHT